MPETQEQDKKFEEAAEQYAKSCSNLFKSLATTFHDKQDVFAKELNAICGSDEKEMVVDFLKGTLTVLAPAKKPSRKLKSV